MDDEDDIKKLDKSKLNTKLTELRDKEREERLRAVELASFLETRSLNTDEKAELATLETSIAANTDEQRDIQRVLEVGNFSSSVNDDLGMNDKETRSYSLIKLIRANCHNASQKDRDAATLELEASSALEVRLGVTAQGMFLPMEVMGEWRGNNLFYDAGKKEWERRDMMASNFSQGGAFIGVDFRAQQMIPLLRNAMALTRAGVTFLDGLVGDVMFPKQTGTATAGWVGRDGGTIGEGNQTLGGVTLTPRTLGVYVDYGRQLRLQSSVSVENFIRGDLMTIMALEKDRVGIHGSGSNGQPSGVEITSGIGTQTFSTASSPTRDEVIGMRTDLATANALINTQAFITNSTVYGNMMSTAIDSGSGRFLISENGTLIGRTLIESNQIESGEMYFGNWSELLVGTWGGLDLLVDPYAGATSGTVRVLVFQSCDLAVRHAQSFCKGAAA